MMHQIVNSNEELIQEQLKDIKQLIIENSSLKEKIKTLEGKYSILLECSKGKVQETLIQQKNSH